MMRGRQLRAQFVGRALDLERFEAACLARFQRDVLLFHAKDLGELVDDCIVSLAVLRGG